MHNDTPSVTREIAHANPVIQSVDLPQIASQLDGTLAQFAGLVAVFEKRLAALEKTTQLRVTVNSRQARAIQRAVSERAKTLCADHNIEYLTFGTRIRDTIWRAFRSEYAVPTAYDLPESQYASALETVKSWNSFAYMRRLRRAEV